jgi:hypothetical protein
LETGNGAITGRESVDFTPMSHFDLSNGLPKCLRQNNMFPFNKPKEGKLKSGEEPFLRQVDDYINVNRISGLSNDRLVVAVDTRPSIFNIVEKDLCSQDSNGS